MFGHTGGETIEERERCLRKGRVQKEMRGEEKVKGRGKEEESSRKGQESSRKGQKA